MSERVIDGVSLRQYAAVYAAVAEGFPLDVVLESEGIALDRWPAIDEAWNDAFFADADAEGILAEDFERTMLELQDAYRRAIPPLDQDLAAWLAFLRAWTAAPDPLAFLREHAVLPNDMVRLHRRWAERFAEDDDVRKQAVAVLQEDSLPPPTVEPEPLELRPVAPAAPRPTGDAEAVPEPPTAVPSMMAGLPAPAAERDAPVPMRVAPHAAASENADATVVDGALPLAGLAAQNAPEVTLAPGASERFDPFAALLAQNQVHLPDAETVAPPDPSLSEEMTLVHYAALVAELELNPDREEDVFAKYGLSDLQRRSRIDAAWRERLETRTNTYAEWRQLYHHFLDHFRAIKQ
jgi:hypothetical protein